MCCDTYSVYSGDIVIAKGMSIETAVILVKALFEEYWKDHDVKFTIEKERDAIGYQE